MLLKYMIDDCTTWGEYSGADPSLWWLQHPNSQMPSTTHKAIDEEALIIILKGVTNTEHC